jgi:hypothetical protein
LIESVLFMKRAKLNKPLRNPENDSPCGTAKSSSGVAPPRQSPAAAMQKGAPAPARGALDAVATSH